MHAGVYNASDSFGFHTFTVSSIYRAGIKFQVTVYFNADKILTKMTAIVDDEQVTCKPKGRWEGRSK
ncbi:BgTH12-02562 [Blumeria graminis f. sp. triticale]|uniref:BgTH12-02562 n=1 Tax=Blumeria graminis f. sp. triticale TaxID=1689686 RepID=A0A9W4D2C0_BLUGR|nr:BgTH12-02562 [Blumeria graminis f. sp. triticale]